MRCGGEGSALTDTVSALTHWAELNMDAVLAAQNAYDSAAQQAAVQAHIHHEIEQFPKGYQTPVGQRGLTLSGGQRQRVTLARTLLGQAPILLLDDPFANVDTETEHAIIEALNQRHSHNPNCITIFASHRFAWVQQAHTIVVLNAHGTVQAVGSHEWLMDTCALYQSLFKKAQGYTA